MTARRRARRASGPAGGTQIGPATVGVLSYELFDAEGELVESSEPSSPLVLLFGFGDAVPALEAALGGLSAGETRDVTLRPDEAFGERDPEALIEVDRSDLPGSISPGDELAADREDGSGPVALKVMEVLDDVVVLDTNHPLAGQKVRLRVTVEAVRPATDAEILEATERLARDSEPVAPPLLPAERLLRRGRGAPPGDGNGPPPSAPEG